LYTWGRCKVSCEERISKNNISKQLKRKNMERETLFTASKWEILKVLEKGEKSAKEIADDCSISLSNVSQQLRFLELGGLIETRRLSNREEGLPRILYRLKDNFSFIVNVSEGFVEKGLFKISLRKKIILKAWFSLPENLHNFFESSLLKIEPFFDILEGLFLDISSGSLDYVMVVDKKDVSGLKDKLNDCSLEFSGVKKKIKFSVIDREEFDKEYSRKNKLSQLYVLHESIPLITGRGGKKVEGGEK
jgi:DNA-binding transcriptional ArsR family regulator